MSNHRLSKVWLIFFITIGPGIFAASFAATVGVSSDQGTQLNEVVVTAERREERLQDVPVPVTAISAETLIDNNRLRLQDYYQTIPGLSLTPIAQSGQVISIRGISSGIGNPTVGVLVDGIPYGSSTQNGAGLVVPDIDPSAIARVEVLRGPQGTLFGASSMGGLLNFVTVDPSANATSGRFEAGTSSVHNGAELGYNFRGSANVPLSDTVALSVSAFTRQDPGYIDNPVLHIDGVNEQQVSGGHLAAMWRPSDVFSAKLSVLLQEYKGYGSNDVQTGTNVPIGSGELRLGDLQQSNLPGTGGYDRKVESYALTLTGKIGSADLTSVSGYSTNQFADSEDYTPAYGGISDLFLGVTGTALDEKNKTNKYSEDLRLTLPIGQRIDWLFGGFYTYEKSQYVENLLAEVPATGAEVGNWLNLSFPTTYAEYAAYTDFTFHVTGQFDIQIGARESRIRQTYVSTNVGTQYDALVFNEPSPVTTPKADSEGNALTYLFTPRYRLTPNLMVYARLASGYRAGGPNPGVSAAFGLPTSYSPDKTEDYDLGLKGDFLGHSLSVDASVYYIDWKKMQLLVFQQGVSYTANASTAKSQGIELSVESKPIAGLTVSSWVALSDASLTQAFPASSEVVGAAGQRLPYSSRFSGNLSLQQDFPLTDRVRGLVAGSLSYVGDREGYFGGAPARQHFPGYADLDLRAGVEYELWTCNVFLTNVADKRGQLTGGLDGAIPTAFDYIQPRTVGLSISRAF